MSRSPRVACALPLLLVALTAAPAAAQKDEEATVAPAAGGRLKLLPVTLSLTDNAEAQAAVVGMTIEAAARRSNRHTFVDPVERFDAEGQKKRQEKVVRADDAMAAGRRAYENLDSGLGIEFFDSAARALEETGLWETFPKLSQANIMRIIVRWADDPPGARKELQRLLAVDPTVELDADLTPTDMQAEATRIRQQRASEPKYGIDVSSTPVAARVYVDGKPRGTTPASVKGLTGGDHYVTLVAPGYNVEQQLVRAGPGASTLVRLTPTPTARPFLSFLDRLKKSFGDQEEVTTARVMGRVLETDELLVAGVKRSAGKLVVEFHRISIKDGHVLAVGSIETSEADPALAAKVDAAATLLLSKDRPRANGQPVGLRSDAETAIRKALDIPEETIKTGLLVASGSLVGLGVLFGILAAGTAGEFAMLPQTDPTLGDVAGRGRGQAIAADVFVGVGLLAGVGWGWLEFGKPLQNRSQLTTPPVLEQRRDEPPPETPKPRKREDDPFDARNGRPEDGARVGVAVWPVAGGASIALGGTF